MNSMDQYNDNYDGIIENYYLPRNLNSPTYSMYYCPLCNYPMPMRDESYDSYEYDDPDEYFDYDEYDDPGYRSRRSRRRRRRRKYFYGPGPIFNPWFRPWWM